MQIITSNGTKAELIDGILYFGANAEGQTVGVGLTCELEELESAIEELADIVKPEIIKGRGQNDVNANAS